jgi:undecaprenyl diphosphate synthase
MATTPVHMTLPVHLGIIPDGNRRWARERGLPSLEGHRRGLVSAKEVALAAFDRGVRYFTVFAFSTENWSRGRDEVGYLMELFWSVLKREFVELEKRKVRFVLLGERDGLPAKLRRIVEETEARTAMFTGGTLAFCLNYGGQAELAAAMRRMLADKVEPSTVTPELVGRYLYGPEIPPVDLVVRTSGEQRLSGFMLWRVAYAELYFVHKHWPDFTPEDLDAALAEFAARQRRYGK